MNQVARLHSRLLWLPKGGNLAEECDDVAAVRPAAGRYAIADGVSDSYDPRRWARLVVEDYVDNAWPFRAAAILKRTEALARSWSVGVYWDGLPWYKAEKATLGAGCAFLGLEFKSDDSPSQKSHAGRWASIAVGDSCLFHLRQDALVRGKAFPILESKEFGLTPPLISTDKGRTQRGLNRLAVRRGTYRPGDTFLLATDALAEHLLRAWENGIRSWSMWSQGTQSDFARYISDLRGANLIRNDDVTLLIIDVLPEDRSETPVIHRRASNAIQQGPSVPAEGAFTDLPRWLNSIGNASGDGSKRSTTVMASRNSPFPSHVVLAASSLPSDHKLLVTVSLVNFILLVLIVLILVTGGLL